MSRAHTVGCITEEEPWPLGTQIFYNGRHACPLLWKVTISVFRGYLLHKRCWRVVQNKVRLVPLLQDGKKCKRTMKDCLLTCACLWSWHLQWIWRMSGSFLVADWTGVSLQRMVWIWDWSTRNKTAGIFSMLTFSCKVSNPERQSTLEVEGKEAGPHLKELACHAKEPSLCPGGDDFPKLSFGWVTCGTFFSMIPMPGATAIYLTQSLQD